MSALRAAFLDRREVYRFAPNSCSAISAVKHGSVVSIVRVLTKRGGYGEKTGDVSSEIR
jgi:hypothetical protein